MINEVFIERLDELIGDYNTPFFNYLMYSYDLSLNECELIVEELKSDISQNRVVADNIPSTLEDYFKKRLMSLEKQDKVEYLRSLIAPESEFYSKCLKRYGLESDDINLIYERIETKIYEDNITDFEIKRYLEYYFANAVKQTTYIADLNESKKLYF
jgi:hypothetical protein